jgi:hypothetical protein
MKRRVLSLRLTEPEYQRLADEAKRTGGSVPRELRRQAFAMLHIDARLAAMERAIADLPTNPTMERAFGRLATRLETSLGKGGAK